MKSFATLFVLTLLQLVTNSALAVNVVDPRCEYRVAPLGIDNPTPRLSWKLEDATHARGQRQTAFQVLVASSREKLDRDTGDLWDSGKRSGSQSVNVPYEGQALASGQECFWKARIWDASGEASDWSQPTRFTMGLLNPSDWTGHWIQKSDQTKMDHNWYRKNFELEEDATSGFVHLASCGYHELYVNGEKVTENVMNPALSFMMTRIPYLTYDISEKLKKGDNVIAVWHAAGWTRWDRTAEYENAPFAFKAQATIETKRGTLAIHTDETWKTKKSNSEYIGGWTILDFGGERIVESRSIKDWNAASCDDSSWSNASIFEGETPANLSAQRIEPQVKYETLSPTSVEKVDAGYVVNMGQAYTGFFEINLRNGTEGQKVTIEISDIEGRASNWKQKSEYVFDSSGTGTFANRFNIGAGQWITLTGIDYKPDLADIKGHIITSDRRRISRFDSSDDLLNWIYETNIDTYLANTLDGILMDCPHRERRGWGEVSVAALYGDALPNFESGAYMEQYAQYLRDTQFEDGRIRGVINENDFALFMWKANNPLSLWETYRILGDKTFLEENYDSMQRWMAWLFENSHHPEGGLKIGARGKFEFPGLGDWCTPMGNFWDSMNSPEANHFNNSLYAYVLNCAAQIAETLGRDEDAKTYADRLAVQQKSTHEASYNPETGDYGSGRQVEQLFPLISGVTPQSEQPKVYANLVDKMLYGFPYYDTGSSGQALYTRYLTEHGERMDLVYELLTDTRHPSYGYFRETGATVWPERWSGVGNSRIHTCYTGIGGYFVKGFGGIRPDPDDLGMKNFLVKPALVGELTYARTEHETMYGRIVVNWKKSASTAELQIRIPANNTAKIYIPAETRDDVFEGGERADVAEGLTYLGVEKSDAVGNYVIYRAESGFYHFESKRLPEVSFPAPLDQGSNLARIGRISASSMYMVDEKNPGYEAFRANDGDFRTRWSAGSDRDQWLELEWIEPQTFDRVQIDEDFYFIRKHRIQHWDGEAWQDLVHGDRCGKQREHRFAPVTSRKVRVFIDSATQSPSITEFRVFRAE